MRNFEQRIAEIHRRSEEILQKRRRRRRLLLSCAPLVLCLGLLAVFTLLPKPEIPAPESSGESSTHSTSCSVARIEISGAGVSVVHTAPPDVQLISNQLSSYTPEDSNSAVVEDSYTSQDDAESGDSTVTDSSSSLAGEYAITLILHDGSTKTYTLTGSILTDQSTHQVCTLTQKQLKVLRDLLGLPEERA